MSSASALACTAIAAQPATAATAPADARLYALMDRVFWQTMIANPTYATSLGLDVGPLAPLRTRLGDYSRAGRVAEMALARQSAADFAAFPDAGLSETAALRLAITRANFAANDLFEAWDMPDPWGVYPLSHGRGAYITVPSFLAATHPMNDAADAQAYLDRMRGFATALDDNLALAREEAARGISAPHWSLELAARQVAGMIDGQPEGSALVTGLAERAQAAGIAGDWAEQAGRIAAEEVWPALLRTRDGLLQMAPDARAGDGIWRIPDGEAFYDKSLRYFTSTDLDAAEIHRIGIEQVAELTADLDALLRSQGMTGGSVGERLIALNERPDQVWEDSDAGRARMLEWLREGYAKIDAKLPRMFKTLPEQPMEIRAVPKDIEEGAPLGYYSPASLDGARPAIYYINQFDVRDWPRYSLPALNYHEAVPGHHLQNAIMQKAEGLPRLMQTFFNTAYSEGWALYAEQVAVELDAYEGLEMAGALQSWLYRAARLVTDTGLHYKRWDRAKATAYFRATVGYAENQSASEVRRYCVWPGQACSYKIGQNKWRELRLRAERELGDTFDVREFHEILKEGDMPLNLLDKRVDAWIARVKG